MLVEIRIYRRHDADLIMLKSYGVNISKMMRLALENYVEGERIKFRLPSSQSCDISKCSMLRYRLNVKNPKVIQLLKQVKRGYRNQFCKALLRDMMDSMALGVYFEDAEAVDFETSRLAGDAMLAQTDLGLITNRRQVEAEEFFEQKRLEKEQEKIIVEENDKKAAKEDGEVKIRFNNGEPLENEMEKTSKPEIKVTETKNDDGNRASDLFSMFEGMRTEIE